mgnify:CR=1 FL=1
MSRHVLVRLALFAIATSPVVLPAQRADSLTVGARVRVELHDGSPPWVIGQWERPSADGQLVIRTGDAPGALRTIPRERVRSLERSVERVSHGEGSRRGLVRGFLIGGGIAAAATMLVGAIELRSGPSDYRGLATGVTAVAGAALTVTTTALGAFVGGQARDRWEAVPVP